MSRATLALTAIVATVCLTSPLAAQTPRQPSDSSLGSISFGIREYLRNPPRIQLDAQVDRGNFCGFPLTARLRSDGDSLVLDRWHLEARNNFCLDGTGPAYATFPLAWGVGTRTLVIRHLGAEDRYRVTVTTEAIRVVPLQPDTRASVLRDTLFWRAPRESFAVGCGGGLPCAELVRLLEREPDVAPIELPSPNPYGQFEGDAGPESPHAYFRARGTESYARVLRGAQALCVAYIGTGGRCPIAIRPWTGGEWRAEVASTEGVR